MNYLVITSITGNKDVLVDPDTTFDNCTYVAFVDEINQQP
jgi:hypothetical protein